MRRAGNYNGPAKPCGLVKSPLPILLSALTAFLLAACSTAPVQLRGTDLGKDASPEFSLTDADGKTVTLTGLRGKVIVLTFLYTRCPDVCPLEAEHLRSASDRLGSAMKDVTFVAVSVDPDNDTAEAVKAFSQQHRLDGKLIYLIGTHTQLQPVWAAYYVAAQPDPLHPNFVSHSSRVVVIDKQGRQRVNMSSDFDPEDLAYNVRVLLSE